MHELKQLTTLEELKSAVATTATRKACTNRRDISLVSVVGEVIARVQFERL